MGKIKVNNNEVEVNTGSILKFFKEHNYHIPAMCYNFEMDPYGACRLCLVNANGRIQAACTLVPQQGLEINTLKEDVISMRKTAIELMLSDHLGDCIGPCQKGCPAHSDVQGYLALIALGKYQEAVKLMKEKYILPATLGRICPAFCEVECRRNYVEGAVSIREVKRFAADYDLEHGPWMPDIPKSTGKKIAVVGGGPAGLSCAFYLRRMGHSVTIFEAMPKLGGMTQYGIPKYRLPKDILDRDIDTIINTGVKLELNRKFGKDFTLDDLKGKYHAVFLGLGAWKSREMGVEGEKLNGVIHGTEFLRKVNIGEPFEIGKRVIVVGGGNTAVDVARTCIRLGSDVTIVYRRSRNEMPANKVEVEEAEEEGVKLELLTNPVRVFGNGKVEKVELVRMRLGELDASGRRAPEPIPGSNFTVDVDTIILAIGQYADESILRENGLGAQRGTITVDKATLMTSIPGVFAGGDLVLGPSTVIESIAQGRIAALMIDQYMKGNLEKVKNALLSPEENIPIVAEDEEIRKVIFDLKPYSHWKTVSSEDYKDVQRIPRVKAPHIGLEERKQTFKEVELTLREQDAVSETERCMSCGCMEVFRCKLKEYATIYNVKQNNFEGETNRYEIDESHDHVLFDNNKCVLCGQCVNLTQEITGEGLVDYLGRGFKTKVATPFRRNLSQMSGIFTGDMIDVCPTGGFQEKLPFIKQGPWKTQSIPTVCNGCGLGCQINLEYYEGIIVRASSTLPSWNNGHICDIGRFSRPWEKKAGSISFRRENREMDLDELRQIVAKYGRDATVVITGDLTIEEAKSILEYAKEKGLKVGALLEEGVSTGNLDTILNAKRIRLASNLLHHPYLKVILHEIVNKDGAAFVDRDEDVLIAEAPYVPQEIPTIVLHKTLNETGLLKLGINPEFPESPLYIVFGNLTKELHGLTIVFGSSPYGDIEVPYYSHAGRSGTVVTDLGMMLQVRKICEENGFVLKDII